MENTKIQELVTKALEEIEQASCVDKLVEIKNNYLGKKSNLSNMTSMIGSLPNEEKKSFGQSIHEAKEKISNLVEEKIFFEGGKLYEKAIKKFKLSIAMLIFLSFIITPLYNNKNYSINNQYLYFIGFTLKCIIGKGIYD